MSIASDIVAGKVIANYHKGLRSMTLESIDKNTFLTYVQSKVTADTAIKYIECYADKTLVWTWGRLSDLR